MSVTSPNKTIPPWLRLSLLPVWQYTSGRLRVPALVVQCQCVMYRQCVTYRRVWACWAGGGRTGGSPASRSADGTAASGSQTSQSRPGNNCNTTHTCIHTIVLAYYLQYNITYVSGTAKTGLLEVSDVASKTSLKLTSFFASAIKLQLESYVSICYFM